MANTVTIYSTGGMLWKYRFTYKDEVYRFQTLREAREKAEALGLEPRLHIFAGV
jgi:hypothetical protein